MATFVDGGAEDAAGKPKPKVAGEVPAGTELESGVSLSKSLLWKAQIAFYQQNGVDSWAKKIVPNYITTNPYMGEAVAKVALANIQDAYLAGLRGGPGLVEDEYAYVIELGTGAGRLGFFVLQALKRIRERLNGRWPIVGAKPEICYVMTDVAMENLEFLLNHERLKPYFDLGWIDCALLDASKPPAALRLLHSGRVVTPGSLRNPCLVVAHYVLCAIEQDAWKVTDEGGLEESVVTLTSPEAETPADPNPELIKRVNVRYNTVPTDAARLEERYREEPAIADVLREYTDMQKTRGTGGGGSTTFLIPVAAIRCIKALQTYMADGVRLAVLSSDKAFNRFEEFMGFDDYPISVEGSLSFMANHDAIVRWCRCKGGGAIYSEAKASTMADACLLSALFVPALGGVPGEGFGDLHMLRGAFLETLSDYGAADHYNIAHVISTTDSDAPKPVKSERRRSESSAAAADSTPEENGAEKDTADDSDGDDSDEEDDDEAAASVAACVRRADDCGFTIQQIVAMLRLTHYDVWCFWLMKSRVIDLTTDMDSAEQEMVFEALEAVWGQFYHIGEDEDVPFELARIAYHLNVGYYPRALEWYKESLRLFGAHYITYYNLALVKYGIKDYAEARRYLDLSTNISNEYEPAHELARELEEAEKGIVPPKEEQ